MLIIFLLPINKFSRANEAYLIKITFNTEMNDGLLKVRKLADHDMTSNFVLSSYIKDQRKFLG